MSTSNTIQFDKLTVTVNSNSSLLPSFLQFNNSNHSSTVPNSKGKKATLLNNVSGHIRLNKLTCLIGGSGAGKSTLLNLLTRRLNSNHNNQHIHVSGSVNLHDKHNNVTELTASDISYVPQQNILLGQLTVYETLYYYAQFTMKHNSIQQKEQRINDIIKSLNLSKCRNTRVGDEYTAGLSGGEKKRLNIAVELIQNKKIIYCDEPTTGVYIYIVSICF